MTCELAVEQTAWHIVELKQNAPDPVGWTERGAIGPFDLSSRSNHTPNVVISPRFSLLHVLTTPHSLHLISFLVDHHHPLIKHEMSSQKALSGKEVATHNTRESCWIIVHGMSISLCVAIPRCTKASICVGNVYDVTEFLDGAFCARYYYLVAEEALEPFCRASGFVKSILRTKCTLLTMTHRWKQNHFEIRRKGCHVSSFDTGSCERHLAVVNRAEYDPIHPPDAITTNLPKEKQCV